ncbi:MAG: hypothetical protein ACR2N2_04460 [Acidimicrobiia bacterium]
MTVRPYPTALGRGLVMKNPSNRFAISGWGVALVVLVVQALLVDGRSVLVAITSSVGVYLAWAVGRELDPDNAGVAQWALVLGLAFALWSPPGALAAGVTMLGIRVVVGTIGAAVRPVDVAALLAIGFAAAIEPVAWLGGVMVLIWLWAAPEVGELRTPGLIAFGVGVVAGASLSVLAIWETSPFDAEVTATAYVLAAVAGAATLLAARPIDVEARTDKRGGRIDAVRVRFGRLGAGTACIWAAVIAGTAGFWLLGPVFAALIVAAVYRVFVHPA